MIVRTYQRRQRGGRSCLSDQGNAAGTSQGSIWSSSQESLTSSFSAVEEPLQHSASDDGALQFPELLHSVRNSCKRAVPGGVTKQKDGRRLSDRHPGAKRSKATSLCDVSKQRSSLGLEARVLLRSSQEECQVKTAPVVAEHVDFAWEATTSSSLMECKESGELLEHVDEANFAMDGLRPGQPLCVQRASLASILSLCGSAQKRRIMRIQGMCRPLLDAIVALPLDDSPIALGAAAVLYLLAIDSHDEDLLDSAPCIQFLMKLLGSGVRRQPERSKGLSTIGSKLLKLSSLKKGGSSGVQALDAGATSVLAKVQELFGGKNAGSRQDEDGGWLHGEEVSPKWLALLTLEKACISTVVLEDTSGGMKKVGGSFKERLRELGGLDAVCYIATSCVTNLRASLRAASTNDQERDENHGGVGMLLRCLRVKENVTFLSELNRTHLLELRLRKKNRDDPGSFVELLLDAIKVLSELVLEQRSSFQASVLERNESRATNARKPLDCEAVRPLERPPKAPIHAGDGSTSMEEADLGFSQSGVDVADDSGSQVCSSRGDALPVFSYKRRTTAKVIGSETREDKTVFDDDRGLPLVLCDSQEVEQEFGQAVMETFEQYVLKESSHRPTKSSRHLDRSEVRLSQNEVPKTRHVASSKEQSECSFDQFSLCSLNEDDRDPAIESIKDSKLGQSQDPRGGKAALLSECLLSAVKVLMNLTNDNPVGCRQVAVHDGLNTMASLIVKHYTEFSALSHKDAGSCKRPQKSGLTSPGHSEEDLDLLVSVLGVLVNLVEKDDGNRARLAKLDIGRPAFEVAESDFRENVGMISLLCSVFLSKMGAGEAVETTEEKIATEMQDELRLKQGQREAEDMIVEAYSALLLAFLSLGSESARSTTAKLLPGQGLTILVPVLERFLAFHLSLNMISPETQASVEDVINSCKRLPG